VISGFDRRPGVFTTVVDVLVEVVNDGVMVDGVRLADALQVAGQAATSKRPAREK